jgi:hypothetical protein
MDLYNLLLHKINNSYQIYNLSYVEIKVLNSFIKESYSCINCIINSINNIISDSKIYLYDIPSIIKTITKIYYTEAIAQEIIKYKYIIDIVQITFDSIIELKIFPLDNEIKEEMIEKFLNISLELLVNNKSEDIIISEENRCCNFISW